MLKDFSLTSLTAGFVAVLVGFTSSAVIVFHAAASAGTTPVEAASWLGALGIGMGLTTIGLSLYYRIPVLTAWSTPGAALLITSLPGVPLPEAIGAFVFSAVLITASGATGWFERIMNRIPMSIAAAMLAGVLLRFGMDVFVSMKSEFALVSSMFFAYLVCKRMIPRYAIVIVLAVGVALAWAQGLLQMDPIELGVTQWVFTMPSFSPGTLIGVGIPLFVVTMASQNIPGIAVMKASGYEPPVSASIGWTGAATLVLAPFGGYALNLAAITAAICMGREAHEDSARRYMAAVSAGVFYLLTGVFAATVVSVFAAFPKELVLAIAGLALLSTIGGSLYTAMEREQQREPALITFLVTASGVSLFGIGSAFWGLIAGALALIAFKRITS
jgi:benzoate membrane transport protein